MKNFKNTLRCTRANGPMNTHLSTTQIQKFKNTFIFLYKRIVIITQQNFQFLHWFFKI